MLSGEYTQGKNCSVHAKEKCIQSTYVVCRRNTQHFCIDGGRTPLSKFDLVKYNLLSVSSNNWHG